MKLIFKILTIFLSIQGQAQLLYLQDNFRGGICVDGKGYPGGAGVQADTIIFQNSVPAGGMVRKAFLITEHHPFFPNPVKDNNVSLLFNGNPVIIDSSNIISSYNCLVKTDIIVKDVSAYVINSNNTLITPCQACILSADTSKHYIYNGFLLIILYNDGLMAPTNAAIFLNRNKNGNPQTFYFQGINPMNTLNDIGLSIWVNDVFAPPDSVSFILNSSLGNNLLGSLYPPIGAGESKMPGSFYYENNTLFGLGDDTPDGFIDTTDALVNIKSYLANTSTSFSLTTNNSISCGIHAFILAGTNPCPPLVNPSVAQSYTTCAGVGVQLAAETGPGFTYNWQPKNNLSDTGIFNPVASPTVSTNYIVTISDSLGCHHTQQHYVGVYTNPKSDSLLVTNAICGDTRGTLTVTPAYNGTSPYNYDIGGGTQSSNVFANFNAGVYNITVTVTDSWGCVYQSPKTFTITEVNTADASFVIQPDLLCEGEYPYIANTSGTVNNYEWYVNGSLISTTQSPNYNFNDTGLYNVTLIAYHNQPQCADTVTKMLFVKDCPPDSLNITVPNIFTPNADEINDVWQPLILESGFTIDIFEVLIYDRWGIKVFESTDTKRGWEGRTTSGIACSEGTYF